jgi:hypothetical protein
MLRTEPMAAPSAGYLRVYGLPGKPIRRRADTHVMLVLRKPSIFFDDCCDQIIRNLTPRGTELRRSWMIEHLIRDGAFRMSTILV